MTINNYYDKLCKVVIDNLDYIPSSVAVLGDTKHLLDSYLEAPASTRWHSNGEGGLALHTYLVMRSVFDTFGEFNNMTSIDMCDLVTAVLWHDMGKIGLVDKTGKVIARYYIKSGDGDYYYNKGLRLTHQELSCMIYTTFVDNISVDVCKAIRFHNMLYTDTYKVIGEETPLMLALHWADMVASRFCE
jgi:hypothetical protein